MEYIEEQHDLFDYYEQGFPVAHCISSDYVMGAGVASVFAYRYGIRDRLRKLYSKGYITINGKFQPCCVYTDGVFNLVTKKNYWDKPDYDSVAKSLRGLKDMIIHLRKEGEKFETLVMPKIGCGIDGLEWTKMRDIIKTEFYDIDIKIKVVYL